MKYKNEKMSIGCSLSECAQWILWQSAQQILLSFLHVRHFGLMGALNERGRDYQ